MKNKLNEIKNIILKNNNVNIDNISKKLNISKIETLHLIINCKDIKLLFNKNNYDPYQGPLVELKKNIKKENFSIIKNNICECKNELCKELKHPFKIMNRKQTKNCTKKLIKIYEELDDVYKKYNNVLLKNDKIFIDEYTRLLCEFSVFIKTIIDKNNFTSSELKD